MDVPALFETMAYDPQTGIARLDRHLARLAGSAAMLGHRYDEAAVRDALRRSTAQQAESRRVRLTLTVEGSICVELSVIPAAVDRVTVAVASLPVSADDYRLRHKTVDRAFYDDARAESAAFEVIFVDAAGYCTEGSFTNIFLPRDGRLLTPPLSRGLLPGILRGDLLDTGEAIEADIQVADLVGGFLIGNALRGLIPAELRH